MKTFLEGQMLEKHLKARRRRSSSVCLAFVLRLVDKLPLFYILQTFAFPLCYKIIKMLLQNTKSKIVGDVSILYNAKIRPKRIIRSGFVTTTEFAVLQLFYCTSHNLQFRMHDRT
jgi:hypothetical protein